jgi:hypothetical protein
MIRNLGTELHYNPVILRALVTENRMSVDSIFHHPRGMECPLKVCQKDVTALE